MRVREVQNVRVLHLFGINGMVLYPFILYSDKEPSVRLRRHEMIHILQIKRLGVFSFYRQYLKEYFSLRLKGLTHDAAYRGISFEKEAYLLEGKPQGLMA